MDIPTKKVGEKARFVNSEGSECVWVVNLLTPLHVLASLESTPTYDDYLKASHCTSIDQSCRRCVLNYSARRGIAQRGMGYSGKGYGV